MFGGGAHWASDVYEGPYLISVTSQTQTHIELHAVLQQKLYHIHIMNHMPPAAHAGRPTDRSDADVQAAVSGLLHHYRSSRQAAIHNDLHFGNCLVSDGPSGQLFLIDYEFSTRGPMAYDLGSVLANFLLAYYSSVAAAGSATAAAATDAGGAAAEVDQLVYQARQKQLLQVIGRRFVAAVWQSTLRVSQSSQAVAELTAVCASHPLTPAVLCVAPVSPRTGHARNVAAVLRQV